MAIRRSPETPAECSFPLAAQIPLQSFVFPTFPPQACRLRELALTADIKLDEYQEILTKHSLEQRREKQLSPNTHTRRSSYTASNSLVFHAPNLPPSIISVTLELFSLGFPVGWLKSIARSLPKLRSLTFFSCLIDGLDEGSREDAINMLEALQLRDLHIIDTFARPGFWREAAIGLSEEHELAKEAHTEMGEGGRSCGQRLQALEMSYTYRGHSDPEFMSRIAGEELPGLLGSGLVAVSFNLLAPPKLSPQEDGFENELLEDLTNLHDKGDLIDNKRPEGILPFPEYGRASSALRKRFEQLSSGKALAKLRMLNISLWTLRPEEIGPVLYSCSTGGSGVLEDLCISVLMNQDWWDELLKSLTDRSQDLERLEVVGVPDDDSQKEQIGTKYAENAFEKTKDLDQLRLACPKLVRFEMTILRAKSFGRVEWKFDAHSGRWNGGISPGMGQNGQ